MREDRLPKEVMAWYPTGRKKRKGIKKIYTWIEFVESWEIY